MYHKQTFEFLISNVLFKPRCVKLPSRLRGRTVADTSLATVLSHFDSVAVSSPSSSVWPCVSAPNHEHVWIRQGGGQLHAAASYNSQAQKVPSAYYIERKKRPTVVLGSSSSSSSSNSGGGGGIEVVVVAEVHYFYVLSVIELSCL